MAAAGAETSRSGATADSYIGSLISLTSKSEIRYEGILYNINTEESSIGLRNVKSFGTEGRKKDGPQISPFDKIYDYILFRGSDIKDLQVKSSPPVQPATQLHNDPAIIQSHYPRPPSTTTSIPSVASGTIPDISSHAGQVGIPRPFQNNLPLYQPGGIMGSWGSSTPTANGSGLGMPMYWQGFYAPTGGVPQHLQQPPLLRPPPGLPMHHSMQQPFQFPGINASLSSVQQSIPDSNAALSSGLLNLPGPGTQFPSGSSNMLELVPSLLPPISGPLSLSSTSLPSTVAHTQAAALAPQMLSNAMSNKPHTSLPVTTLAASLPSISNSASKLESISVSSKPAIPGSNIGYQAIPHPVSSTVGVSISSQGETALPSLVTPGQLFQTGPSTVSSSQPVQPAFKEDEIKTREPEDKDATSRPQKTSPTESNEPILPLPTPVERKPMGASVHNYHNNRGRGRGRGNAYPRAVTKFAEDFDFTAMNEKFKKDEVWGHLGKNKGYKEGYANEDYDDDNDVQDEEDAHSSKAEVKPVYVKDDFFDTLSCNTLDRENRNGRTKFSEQLKIDTETFGDFSRYRGSRGGRGFHGGRTRGSYYGRGYGYGGRGRGRGPSPSTRAM